MRDFVRPFVSDRLVMMGSVGAFQNFVRDWARPKMKEMFWEMFLHL